MTGFAARQSLTFVVRLLLLAVAAAPCIALSQQTVEAFREREREIEAGIEREESLNGPYSPDLIGPLTSLSLLYEEDSDFERADATIERLLQVIRANYGLYSLEQGPPIRRLIAHELARGNAQSAWQLEQELLTLARRHPDELQTARILRDIGDRRFDILERYNSGEFPQEIVLGCYYDDSNEYLLQQRRGSRPLMVTPGTRPHNSCAAGSRSRAQESLKDEGHIFYRAAISVYLGNELYQSEELRDLLTKVVHTSHRYGEPALGRQMLRYLVSYEAENAETWLPRIEALIQVADWDLLYSPKLGTNYRDAAVAEYQDAYDLLHEHGIAEETVDALFSPRMPILLPSFTPNPLESPETPASTGYVDVSFVVTVEGKGEDVEVLDTTTGSNRSAERDLVKLIERSRFRPTVTDGRLADSEPFVVRYHLQD